MLANSNVVAFVPTRNAAVARNFYSDVLGLTFVTDDQFAIVMEANGTQVRIVRVGEFNPAPYTILGWAVEDIEQAASDLSGRGVVFERYTFLEQSEAGIWTAPEGARVAWFLDPDRNILSLSQHPKPDAKQVA